MGWAEIRVPPLWRRDYKETWVSKPKQNRRQMHPQSLDHSSPTMNLAQLCPHNQRREIQDNISVASESTRIENKQPNNRRNDREMFPSSLKEATFMSLANNHRFHPEPLTRRQRKRKLKNDGDFIIQKSKDGENLLLAVRQHQLHEYIIEIVESCSTISFSIEGATFNSLDSLVNYLINRGIRSDENLIKFRNVLTSSKGIHGHLGVEFTRCASMNRTGNQYDFPDYQAVRLVVLKREINTIERKGVVVELLRLKHEVPNRLSPIFTEKNLSVKTRCGLIVQAASGMFYLNRCKVFNVITNTQRSFIDKDGTLKIGSYYIGDWEFMQDQIKNQDYCWRFVNPCYFDDPKNEFNSDQLMYNWSVLSWEIAIGAKLLPYSQFETLAQFWKDRKYVNLTLPHIASIYPPNDTKYSKIRKIIDSNDPLPSAISEVISKAMRPNDPGSISWETLLINVSMELPSASLTQHIKKFFSIN